MTGLIPQLTRDNTCEEPRKTDYSRIPPNAACTEMFRNEISSVRFACGSEDTLEKSIEHKKKTDEKNVRYKNKPGIGNKKNSERNK